MDGDDASTSEFFVCNLRHPRARPRSVASRRMRARAQILSGNRLHLQDGPIDLVIGADGPANAVRAAQETAIRRFATILDELCGELPLLRAAARPGCPAAQGHVPRRMQDAVAPFVDSTFLTPMAAVAGSVADAILSAMVGAADLRRAYVNNGGDIALHLAPGETFRVGLVDRPDRRGLFGDAVIRAADPVRGIATSGWPGRSFSLGIADAVTILAADAATADAAATVVANAVDLPGHPAVTREPACAVHCDSDLGDRLVTRGVGPLARSEIDEALAQGCAVAERLVERGLIRAAALHLQGVTTVAGSSAGPLLQGRLRIANSPQHSSPSPQPSAFEKRDLRRASRATVGPEVHP